MFAFGAFVGSAGPTRVRQFMHGQSVAACFGRREPRLIVVTVDPLVLRTLTVSAREPRRRFTPATVV